MSLSFDSRPALFVGKEKNGLLFLPQARSRLGVTTERQLGTGPWNSPRPSLPNVYCYTSQSLSCINTPLTLSCVPTCPLCPASQLAPVPQMQLHTPTPGPLHVPPLSLTLLFTRISSQVPPSAPRPHPAGLHSRGRGQRSNWPLSPASVSEPLSGPTHLVSIDSLGGRGEDSRLSPHGSQSLKCFVSGRLQNKAADPALVPPGLSLSLPGPNFPNFNHQLKCVLFSLITFVPTQQAASRPLRPACRLVRPLPDVGRWSTGSTPGCIPVTPGQKRARPWRRMLSVWASISVPLNFPHRERREGAHCSTWSRRLINAEGCRGAHA